MAPSSCSIGSLSFGGSLSRRSLEKRTVHENFNGSCCTKGRSQGSFCMMAHRSSRKKSRKDDSNSDSEDEVNRDLDLLLKEIDKLDALL